MRSLSKKVAATLGLVVVLGIAAVIGVVVYSGDDGETPDGAAAPAVETNSPTTSDIVGVDNAPAPAESVALVASDEPADDVAPAGVAGARSFDALGPKIEADPLIEALANSTTDGAPDISNVRVVVEVEAAGNVHRVLAAQRGDEICFASTIGESLPDAGGVPFECDEKAANHWTFDGGSRDGQTEWTAVAGVTQAAGDVIVVTTKGGETINVETNDGGGFSYVATRDADVPTRVAVRDASGAEQALIG